MCAETGLARSRRRCRPGHDVRCPAAGSVQQCSSCCRYPQAFFFFSKLWLFCYYQPVRRAGLTRGRRLPSRAPVHSARHYSSSCLVILSFSSLSHAAVHLVRGASGRPSQRLNFTGTLACWSWPVSGTRAGFHA